MPARASFLDGLVAHHADVHPRIPQVRRSLHLRDGYEPLETRVVHLRGNQVGDFLAQQPVHAFNATPVRHL